MKLSIAELEVIMDTLHNSLKFGEDDRIFRFTKSSRGNVCDKLLNHAENIKLKIELDDKNDPQT